MSHLSLCFLPSSYGGAARWAAAPGRGVCRRNSQGSRSSSSPQEPTPLTQPRRKRDVKTLRGEGRAAGVLWCQEFSLFSYFQCLKVKKIITLLLGEGAGGVRATIPGSHPTCTGAVGAMAVGPNPRLPTPVLLSSARSVPQTRSHGKGKPQKSVWQMVPGLWKLDEDGSGAAVGSPSIVPGLLCISAVLWHLPKPPPSRAAHEMTKNSKCRGSWHGASVSSHTSHSSFSIALAVRCTYLLSLLFPRANAAISGWCALPFPCPQRSLQAAAQLEVGHSCRPAPDQSRAWARGAARLVPGAVLGGFAVWIIQRGAS